ncbi:MAG TPA: RNA-binding domain-containing protein, partial [Pyrinomonadaceae bacterium]|nr:RNA-binding domain-containing protein [Pyrinomonadaceae bacterium]
EKITQGIVALANTDGGTIIFGVSDQMRIEGVNNPEWVQEELVRICRDEIIPPVIPLVDTVAFDNGKRIVTLEVVPRNRPYRTRDGKFYMRFGAEKREIPREQLSSWIDELRPVGYESLPIFDATESDFDDSMLWSFASEFTDTSPTINIYQTAAFLKNDLALAVGEQGEFFPTVAAMVLFGKNERVRDLFPRSSVSLLRISGENGNQQTVEKVKITANLHNLYEAIMKFVERYCDLSKDKPRRRPQLVDSFAVPRSIYNLYAVREAVANLLIHRDFSLKDIESRIIISDRSIEFINARRSALYTPQLSRAIRYGIAQRINPTIAAVFTRREYGINPPKGGLPMILKQTERFAGRRAEIYTSNDEFRLKIPGA